MNAYRPIFVLCLSLVLVGCNQQTELVPDATPAPVTENTPSDPEEPQSDPSATKPVVKNTDSTPVEKITPSHLNNVASAETPAELPNPIRKLRKS